MRPVHDRRDRAAASSAPSPPWRCFCVPVSIVLLVVLTVGLTRVARGHNGEDAPRPPKPDIARKERVYPPRWSWVHWWEANRDPYLEIIQQQHAHQPWDEQVLDDLYQRSVDALLAALQGKQSVRSAAVMALGRMQEPTAFQSLAHLAQTDRSEEVRTHALVALGLLDLPESEEFLLGVELRGTGLRVARLIALGLLSAPSPAVTEALRQALKHDNAARATTAAWALQQQPGPASVPRLRRLVRETGSPWLASEALLTLGRHGDAKAAPIIAHVLSDTRRDPKYDVLEDLWALYEAKRSRATGSRAQYTAEYNAYIRDYERFQRRNPNAPPPEAKAPTAVTARVNVGLEKIYVERLRASAAIAAAGINDRDTTEALLALLAEKDDEYNVLSKGFAAMSLGQLGTNRALAALLELADERSAKDHYKSQEKLESPVRGYAALALGIYARPVWTPQGWHDRRRHQRALDLLEARLADKDEKLEMRTACAVALGLVGRTEGLPKLQSVAGKLGKRDDLLEGYILLARGMLGDGNMIAPAAKLLRQSNEDTSMAGILARRAAVLGLGLTGRGEAIPVLTEAWHLNHYVNREVITALSLCQAYGVAKSAIESLWDSDDPGEQAFMAAVLGELFTAVRPPRLAGLTYGSNYTMKNERRQPYQMLANEFLFRYLIPAFGREWR